MHKLCVYMDSSHIHLHVGMQTALITHQPVVDQSPRPSPIFGRTRDFFFTESTVLSLIFCFSGGFPALFCLVPAIYMSLLVRLPGIVFCSCFSFLFLCPFLPPPMAFRLRKPIKVATLLRQSTRPKQLINSLLLQ